MMDFQPVRGTRDFFGTEAAERAALLRVLEDEFQLYSFNRLDTPAMENLDFITSKYAGGAEILKEKWRRIFMET